MKNSQLLLLLGIVLLVALWWQGSLSTTATSTVDLAQANALVQRSQQEGYITSFDCTDNVAHVRTVFWQGLDAGGKRGLALSLAAICGSRDAGNRITINDSQSGRKLAAISSGRYSVE